MAKKTICTFLTLILKLYFFQELLPFSMGKGSPFMPSSMKKCIFFYCPFNILMLYKLVIFLFSIKLREKTYNFKIKSVMCKRSIGTNLLVKTFMRSCQKKLSHSCKNMATMCNSCLKIHVQSISFAI